MHQSRSEYELLLRRLNRRGGGSKAVPKTSMLRPKSLRKLASKPAGPRRLEILCSKRKAKEALLSQQESNLDEGAGKRVKSRSSCCCRCFNKCGGNCNSESSADSDENEVKTCRRSECLNTVDPIMFEPIGSNSYIFHHGSVSVAFNLESLIDYMIASGHFVCPVSRALFSDGDLREMDQLAADYGLDCKSVLKAKSDAGRYADARFRTDALLGIDRLAGEQVAEMLAQAEKTAARILGSRGQSQNHRSSSCLTTHLSQNDSLDGGVATSVPLSESKTAKRRRKKKAAARCRSQSQAPVRLGQSLAPTPDPVPGQPNSSSDDPVEGESESKMGTPTLREAEVDESAQISSLQMRLLTESFPTFADLYSQLHAADAVFARSCMSHYQNFLVGPPNKPLPDPCGFLRMVRQFLKSEAAHAEHISQNG